MKKSARVHMPKNIIPKSFISNIKKNGIVMLAGLLWFATLQNATAQSSPAKIDVPDWALPGSATHKQVPPPPDFHRPSRTEYTPIGIFTAQSDVGGALVPGSSIYNAGTKQYTIISAGYNIWYTRDEFRYLWKKMSGDISFSVNVKFTDSVGYDDRKALVIIRQSLDDDSKEAMVALHGAGLVHLAWRPDAGQNIQDMRVDTKNMPGGTRADGKTLTLAQRIGIEKHGDEFSVFVSMTGEPMHQFGAPIHLHIDGPLYIGLAFCSHQPDKTSGAILSDVVLVNEAGKVR